MSVHKIKLMIYGINKKLTSNINASINIRNYGLGQIDIRNTTRMIGIEACGVPTDGVATSYGVVASYGSVKQEARSSLAIG